MVIDLPDTKRGAVCVEITMKAGLRVTTSESRLSGRNHKRNEAKRHHQSLVRQPQLDIREKERERRVYVL